MAELAEEFLAERLHSRQLLALLFVCECRRKKTLETLSSQTGIKPAAWTEFVDRFGARLANLPEAERVYLIGSHLQSAEEIDIYSNAEISALLNQHQDLMNRLVLELEKDIRFA
jgi:hypothetical protein